MVCSPLRMKRPRRNHYVSQCLFVLLGSNEISELVADVSEFAWIFMELLIQSDLSCFQIVFSMADTIEVPSVPTGGAVLRITHHRVETPGCRERKCTIPGDLFSRIFLAPLDPFWMFAKRLVTVMTLKLALICSVLNYCKLFSRVVCNYVLSSKVWVLGDVGCPFRFTGRTASAWCYGMSSAIAGAPQLVVTRHQTILMTLVKVCEEYLQFFV